MVLLKMNAGLLVGTIIGGGDTQKFQILCTLRQWDAKTSGASAHYEPPGETFTT